MLTLVIDTALGVCQAAVARDGRVLAERSEPMQRGHQERIAPMTAVVMAEAKVGFADLGRIAVTLGPGSFTGVRVGLAFARGLALATGAALVGVGTLEALAASGDASGRTCGVIDARRDQVYAQAFEAGASLWPPAVLSVDEAAERFASLAVDQRLTLVGPGAAGFAGDRVVATERSAPDIAALARIAVGAAITPDAKPIYLRAPDIRGPAA